MTEVLMSEVTITIDKSSYGRPSFKVGEVYHRYNMGYCMCIKSVNGSYTMKPIKHKKYLRRFQITWLTIKIKLGWL